MLSRHDYDVIVTWRHRLRRQSTRRWHFSIGSLLHTNPLNRLVSDTQTQADRRTHRLTIGVA